MNTLRRLLGVSSPETSESRDTDTVRKITAQLEALPQGEARYIACFAYVLARIAQADFLIDERETEEIKRQIATQSDLSEEGCDLVVEIAKNQADLLGGTENYVVTRQFREISSPGQRSMLVSCAFAVAASNGEISAEESAELTLIGEELGFTRSEINSFRSKYRDKLSVLKR
jgi:uncharacterized tellurite resistance protein B-like protein